MNKQTTPYIVMIRPVNFRMNEETAVNNYYQKILDSVDSDTVQNNARSEFDNMVKKLEDNGVCVIVIEDTEVPNTPDSIFPNNWISFHQNGKIGLYPMFAENRRDERREDIFDVLRNDYQFLIEEIVDFTEFEEHGKYLEGTGSMLLDRENKVVYAAISERTDEVALEHFAEQFDYSIVPFVSYQTVNKKRLPIYHTNVMMCLAEEYSVICLDTIDDSKERELVVDSLKKANKEIIEISEDQVNRFAGNMLQVRDEAGDKFLVMSDSAYHSLTDLQKEKLESFQPIIHSSLDTIEACGGGSARCMMAEVFLPKF